MQSVNASPNFMSNFRYVQSVLDCQFAACPALTDDEKQAIKDNFLTQLKEGGIDCCKYLVILI